MIKGIFQKRSLLNISFIFTMVVIGLCFTVTNPALIELSKSTHITIETAGYIYSFMSIGFIIGCYLSIWLITYWKRKNLLLIAYIILFISVFFMRFAYSFILIAGLFILMGLAIGFSDSQMNILLIESNEGSEGLFVNLGNASFGIGAFLGPLLTGSIIDLGFYWKNTYIVVGILCVINIILLVIMDLSKYEILEVKITPNIFKSVRLYNGIIFILLMLIVFFYMGSETVLSGWIPSFLRIERTFTEFSAAQVLSFFWLAAVIGRISTGLLTKRFSILKILISITILSIISIIFGLYSNIVIRIFISLILSGFFVAGIFPLIVTEVGILYPKNRNSLVSIIILFSGTGYFFVPFIFGLTYNKFGILAAMNLSYIFLFLLLICVLVLFLLRKNTDIKNI